MEVLTSRDLFILVAGGVIGFVIPLLIKPPKQEMGMLWLGIKWYLAFTRRGRLRNLERYRALLERLNTCDRDYYGLLFSIVLLVLMALAAGGILFPAMERLNPGPETSVSRFVWSLFAWLAGILAVVIAFGGWRLHDAMRQYDTTIASLDQQIATLLAQLPDAGGEIP